MKKYTKEELVRILEGATREDLHKVFKERMKGIIRYAILEFYEDTANVRHVLTEDDGFGWLTAWVHDFIEKRCEKEQE